MGQLLKFKPENEDLRRAGQTELVFLVDSSASVGSDNFYNEIKFIRKVGFSNFALVSFQLQGLALTFCVLHLLGLFVQTVSVTENFVPSSFYTPFVKISPKMHD